MKKSCFWGLVATGILLFSGPLHAQFLKKLKDKVNKAVDKTIGGAPESNGSSGNSGTGSGGSSSGGKYSIDFAKHNISTTIMYLDGNIKEQTRDFQPQLSVYELRDTTVVGKVVVYASAAQNGEAGEYSGKDIAYVFENGKLASKTTVAAEDKNPQLLAEYALRDWPFENQSNTNYIHTQMNDSGQWSSVHFRGKTYGGYMLINHLLVSKDSSKFYAIGGEATKDGDLVYYFFSSDGRKVKLPSAATGMLVNDDFSNAAVYGFVGNIDEEKAKTGSTLAAAGSVLNHGDVYFITGRVLKSATATGNGWLDLSGKNILKADRYSPAYINGKKVADGGVTPGNLWCNAPADKWCYYALADYKTSDIDQLVFSDGTDVPMPIHPQQVAVQGRTYIVWFQRRNGLDGDLLLCKKAL